MKSILKWLVKNVKPTTKAPLSPKDEKFRGVKWTVPEGWFERTWNLFKGK